MYFVKLRDNTLRSSKKYIEGSIEDDSYANPYYININGRFLRVITLENSELIYKDKNVYKLIPKDVELFNHIPYCSRKSIAECETIRGCHLNHNGRCGNNVKTTNEIPDIINHKNDINNNSTMHTELVDLLKELKKSQEINQQLEKQVQANREFIHPASLGTVQQSETNKQLSDVLHKLQSFIKNNTIHQNTTSPPISMSDYNSGDSTIIVELKMKIEEMEHSIRDYEKKISQ